MVFNATSGNYECAPCRTYKTDPNDDNTCVACVGTDTGSGCPDTPCEYPDKGYVNVSTDGGSTYACWAPPSCANTTGQVTLDAATSLELFGTS